MLSPDFGSKRAVSLQEMKERSKRRYNNLPEVKKARAEKAKAAGIKERLAMVKAYDEVTKLGNNSAVLIRCNSD